MLTQYKYFPNGLLAFKGILRQSMYQNKSLLITSIELDVSLFFN